MGKPNRYYTLMVIPENSTAVRRWIIPSWIVRTGGIAGVFGLAILAIMLLDYRYVMGRISENKDLRVENRELRQQVQVFEGRISTIEETMERVRTFSTRLKVITNIEDRDKLVESLNEDLPEAASNTGVRVAEKSKDTPKNPEDARLALHQADWELRFDGLARQSSLLEQQLNDQYELLSDQKAFLDATPTRKPAVGYFTSGFGVRRSPYGGREKMHEGLDIANYPGTAIRAPADGTVVYAGNEVKGMGNLLLVSHNGGYITAYGNNEVLLVKKGDTVRKGQEIAKVGSSSGTGDPRLHFEVRRANKTIDPTTVLPAQ